MRINTVVTTLLFALLIFGATRVAEAREIDLSVRLEAKAAIRRGARFLEEAQLANGSWTEHPVITSLAALALTKSGETDLRPANLNSALDYISAQAHEDGAIWNRQSRQYPLYSTALSMLALVRSGRPQDLPIIKAAREYLISCQRRQIPRSNTAYGGFVHDKNRLPSLTISQWVLEALYLTDHLDDNSRRSLKIYRDALEFIMRCQRMLEPSEVNACAGGTGCFHDFPGEGGGVMLERAPGTPRSAAFLTAVGLKSLIYAGCQPTNPLVKSAVQCLQRSYTVSENPGLGKKGFYTYLFVLAKTLDPLGIEKLSDTGGEEHFWRREVVLQLLKRQKGNGSWRNADPAWWENHPELVTAYALLTMDRCLDRERVRIVK
ncbi:MAG: prenyltransferase/squalene oxidase repeat-containing protein [Lentisphaeria bacterium]